MIIIAGYSIIFAVEFFVKDPYNVSFLASIIFIIAKHAFVSGIFCGIFSYDQRNKLMINNHFNLILKSQKNPERNYNKTCHHRFLPHNFYSAHKY